MNAKKIGALALALLMAVGVFMSPACATSFEDLDDDMMPLALPKGENSVEPRWSYISSIHPGLSSSGNTLYADVSVVAESSTSSITGTMFLEEEVATNDWDSVKSWAIQGTGSAFREGTYSGDSGSTYRLRVKVWVGGESATAYSYEVTL